MRKILLSLSAIFAFGVVNAQNDISIALNSPTTGTSIGPGLPFTFDVTITNAGTVAVAADDTLIYYPTINGGLLTTTNQAGQTVTVAFRLTGSALAANGSVTPQAVNFGGLNINGAPAGNVDICGNVIALGPNWRNVVESDTLNNSSCATASYDPNGGIGLAENIIYAQAQKLAILDASYANGSTYFVEAYNLSSSNATVSLVDLTGRTLASQEFEVINSELKGEMSLNSLPNGVVLAVLSVDGQAVSTKKVIVAK